ncbi:unnamed protein product [Cylindrotheca closterium]|uniref:J domain-containing protein n=1 Tax=Cylindrotheca closterium TaxID=2856 RepID=A0AAD2FUY6_9STRA|nr:unnamed protein product [Cylindrotheca closterium]
MTSNGECQTANATEKEDWEIQRDYHKSLADAAFRVGAFRTAIAEYSKSIDLEKPSEEVEEAQKPVAVSKLLLVLYSNRSAAYLRNSEKSKALKDAQMCVELDPKFIKGHSRLASALHSLKRYEQAHDAYNQVLKLDATNPPAKKGAAECAKALEAIKQQAFELEQDRKERLLAQEQADEEESKGLEKEKDEEKQQSPEEAEDDLLNDFFDEVEEVTTKKEDELKADKATNFIKNDRKTLGSAKQQMDRLLQSNYEWRNLNPFYVLQLPVEATDDDISRRYKALSLLLHPDKSGGSDRAQLAYDQVQKAKNTLNDPDRTRHTRMLIEEGMKVGQRLWKTQKAGEKRTLQEVEEREIMRLFAQVEQKRKEVTQRERQFQQREQQQEDQEMEKERKSRQFDKQWRDEGRVDKRIGNWRDFQQKKKPKKD